MEDNLTLGKRLRQITENALVSMEVENFYKVLEAEAKQGKSQKEFNDLREYLNTMLMNGTAWEWLKLQELIPLGEVDQSTGAYKFTISW